MYALLLRGISVTTSITIAFFAHKQMQQRCPQWSSAQGQESTNLFVIILITNFDKTSVGTLGDKTYPINKFFALITRFWQRSKSCFNIWCMHNIIIPTSQYQLKLLVKAVSLGRSILIQLSSRDEVSWIEPSLRQGSQPAKKQNPRSSCVTELVCWDSGGSYYYS